MILKSLPSGNTLQSTMNSYSPILDADCIEVEQPLENLRQPRSVVTTRSPILQPGWVDPQKMTNTVSVVVQGYGISSSPSAPSLYTDQFAQSP